MAAHLALGRRLADAGEEIAADSLVDLPGERAGDRGGEASWPHVVSVDGFGNAVLDLSDRHLAQIGLRLGSTLSVEGPGGELTARRSR